MNIKGLYVTKIDGSWTTVTQTPMGDQVAELTLQTSGDSLTGTRIDAMGTMEIENGKVEGNRATWTMNLTMPFQMELEADVTFDGDTLSGTIRAGSFGTSPVTGTRKS